MQELFRSLTRAVQGPPGAALLAAAAWGALSILLSPCHLASIPLIVAFVDERARGSVRRAFGVSLAFAVGILITVGVVGVATAAAGRIMGDLGGWTNYFVAVLFFLVGLHLLDVLPMPFSPRQPDFRRQGFLAAFLLGLIFGVALGPCTFAFMAPMIGLTLKLGASDVAWAARLFAAFALGHCAVLTIAGTSTGLVSRYLNWTERSRGAIVLRRICGALILVGGLYLVYTA